MKYENRHVLYMSAEFGVIESPACVINGWAVESEGEEILFRKITGWSATGQPMVNMAATKLFSVAVDCEISIRDIAGLTGIELAEKYAK